MDIFVFGVGRSGTTMVYSLIQYMLGKHFDGQYRSTYEPYVWNRDIFDAPYEKTLQSFGKTASVSIEGIYNHLQTPLFIGPDYEHPLEDNTFYRHFRAGPPNAPPHVFKLIRGNGRMAWFRRLNPDARFVLVIRNPVDVVNSVKHKFSFYGEDFYPSDFPRFCEELERESQLVLHPSVATWAQRQAEYSYQMSRSALEYAKTDDAALVLEYDDFVRNTESGVDRLCRFLALENRPDFLEKLASPTGPVTAKVTLSRSEFTSIWEYDTLYNELCYRSGLTRGKPSTELLEQYEARFNEADYNPEYDDYTTNRLRLIIRQKNDQIRTLEEKLGTKPGR